MSESVVINSNYIVKTPGICGGRARIDGTRIGVDVVVGLYLSGATIEEIAEGYADSGVTPAKIHAALAYYYDHQEEIDSILDDYRQMAEAGRQREDRDRAERGLPPAGAYITSREAAAILGVAHESRRVAQLCRSGRLDGRKVGRDWLVSRRSVNDYARRRRKPDPRPT